jgi:hypothetical protein
MLKRATTVAFLLMLAQSGAASATDWGALDGTWLKLPVACGANLEKTCGGDQFSLRNGKLTARKTCKNVSLAIRRQTEDMWHVSVVGANPCIWAKGVQVRHFVFKIGPAPAGWLQLRGYSRLGPTGEEESELFRGYGFERI